MFRGKALQQLSQEEWEAFATETMHKDIELRKREKELELEKKQLEAAQQLTRLANNEEGSRVVTNTVIKGTIGSINEFVLSDNWQMWYDRFEQYCFVNEVPEDKRVPLFITSLGKDAYALLWNLCSPDIPTSKSLGELKETMRNHLQPTPSVIMERYKFRECRQQPDEDIKTYLANLKQLSTYCDFGANLEVYLRDQFVWGITSETIKKRLLGEKDLTYKKAVETAQCLETAGRDAAKMNLHGGGVEAVNFVNSKSKLAHQKTAEQRKNEQCFCCGKSGHRKAECYHKNSKCKKCGRSGHLQSMCNKKPNSDSQPSKQNERKKSKEKQHFVEEEEQDQLNSVAEIFDSMFCLQEALAAGRVSNKPLRVNAVVEGKQMYFEVDTGSPITAVSEKVHGTLKNLCKLPLEKTERIFKTYHEKSLIPVGKLSVNVQFGNKREKLEIFVLPGNTEIPIMGREWLNALGIIKRDHDKVNISINSLTECNNIKQNIVKNFPNVFGNKTGLYKGGKFTLYLKPESTPVFCKVRTVPFALRDKIEQEIDRLVKAKILEPVESSDWATPVVPVLKSNGKIRLCGDYKITVNPKLIVDKFPIPKVIDLLSKLSGGKFFSKLDLSHAYQQIELDDESKNLTTITTHKGLFRYNRLSYGIASAPGLFQREMEKVVSGIPGVTTYFDDVFVAGGTREEHDKRLYQVLERFQTNGLTARIEKCQFAVPSIQFLGYRLDERGLLAATEKVDAIVNMQAPRNIKELQSFVGALTYNSKFIKNFASLMSPLYELLRKGVEWQWTPERDRAFQEAKKRLIDCDLLVHYRSDVPIKITCDASPYGLGAVLSHVFSSGEVKPIAYASRVLTSAERNYAQLDREALALIYGVKAFHQYVYGRKFILETDHKPLSYIFGSKKGIPVMAASRVQRWAVMLSGYDFEIKYIKGSENGPADALSRVPTSECKQRIIDDHDDYNFLNFVTENAKLINVDRVRQETTDDPILNKVLSFIRNGWPENINEELQPYKNRQLELYIENACIFWGHRVVIPAKLKNDILEELHGAHMGIVKMKALARSYVWWPQIDRDIERIVKSCELCLRYNCDPPRAQLHVWQWPGAPNERLHIDFCGPINGHMYIVIVDAYSKWLDVRELPNITAATTIKVLKEYISVWGLPDTIVSDNGPTFTSVEFQTFLKLNSIKHVLTPPYHPASNGAAENAVRTFKNKFKLLTKKMSNHDALYKYLLSYRSTPHCTTGCSPARLHLGRELRTRLSAVNASAREVVERRQHQQKLYFHGNRKIEFEPHDNVMAKDIVANQWRNAEVVEKVSPVIYNVKVDDGRIWKRHTDQLRTCASVQNTDSDCERVVRPSVSDSEPLEPVQVTRRLSTPCKDVGATRAHKINCDTVGVQTPAPKVTPAVEGSAEKAAIVVPRRSSRIRKAPQRLDL